MCGVALLEGGRRTLVGAAAVPPTEAAAMAVYLPGVKVPVPLGVFMVVHVPLGTSFQASTW